MPLERANAGPLAAEALRNTDHRPEAAGNSAPLAAERAPALHKTEFFLAEYLRRWGLHQPSIVAMHCRRWAVQALEAAGDNPALHERGSVMSECSRQAEAARAAFDQAEREMETWIDQLTQLIAPEPVEAAARRGLTAMALQEVIDDYPEAFLQYPNIPAALWQRLAAAAHPVVPKTAAQARMSGPSLGKLPPLLQPQKWRHIFSRIAAPLRILTGFKQGR